MTILRINSTRNSQMPTPSNELPPIGFMPQRIQTLAKSLEKVVPPANFIEISVQDQNISRRLLELEKKYQEGVFDRLQAFDGYLVLHGEGERDGVRRIGFARKNRFERQTYVKFLAEMYQDFDGRLDGLVKSIVLHPDRLRKDCPRDEQIELLANSLTILSDLLPNVTLVLESRGSKDPKVVRPFFEDIQALDNALHQQGAVRVQHCLDIAQTFIFAGIDGVKELIGQLEATNICFCELHVSDVGISSLGYPQVARGVGLGQIPWNKIIDVLKAERMLLEVFGGVNIFLESWDFLSRLANGLSPLYPENSQKSQINSETSLPLAGTTPISPIHDTPQPFFFYRRKDSLFKPSPGTRRIIDLCYSKNLVPESVLDLGCGNGRNALAIAQEFGSRITLIDSNERTLRTAYQNLEELGCQVEQAIVHSIENLDPKNFSSFDIVLLSYVLQNIHPVHYDKVLHLVYGWTKHYVVFEIYQNPLIYEEGIFTIRRRIGWYGFRPDEFVQLISTRSKILWELNKNPENAPATFSMIGVPLPPEKLTTWKYPETVKIRRISPQRRTKYYRQRNFRTSPRHTSSQLSPSILDHPFKKLYPPCRVCTIPECKETNCSTLQKWASDVLSHIPGRPKPIPSISKKKTVSLVNIPLEYKKQLYTEITTLRDNFPQSRMLSEPALAFVASRRKGIPLSLGEICAFFGSSRSAIFKEVSVFQRKVDGSLKFKPIAFEDYVKRYMKSLNLNASVQEKVGEILEAITANSTLKTYLRNSSPTAVAAGILRLATIKEGKKIPLKQLSRVAMVSEVTVRNKVNQFRELLGL